MLEDKIKQYAYYILFISLAFNILNIAGITQVTITIGGFDVMEDITSTVTEIQEKFITASNSIEYSLAAGFLFIMGTKVLIEFLLLIVAGMLPVMAAILGPLGIPAIIYAPIVSVMIALAVFDFAKTILRIT